MIGGIVGQGEGGYRVAIDRDDERGGEGVEVGLRIAVGKTAGIGCSLAAHEVTFGGGVGTILAVETLG